MNYKMDQKKRLTDFLRTKPVFLVLLPCFFVLHGCLVNYSEVPAGDALLLTVIYVAAAFVIAGIAKFLLGSFSKACLFSLAVMSFYFFFGSVQDMVTKWWPGSFLLRYRFILPFSLLLFVLVIVWLRRTSRSLNRLTAYLNTVLLVILLADIAWLLATVVFKEKEKVANVKWIPCDTCHHPDIFYIIPDQYPGHDALKALFHFDNSAFEQQLEARGFHIAKNSSSNYNLTPFSVASTLSMDFISIKEGAQDYGSVGYSYRVIRNNPVFRFLSENNYRFYNCSIFNFPGQPANEYGAFLPYGTRLITMQTFSARLWRDYEADIKAGKFGRYLQQKAVFRHQHFNEAILSQTQEVAALKITQPKLVYTHLMMPHFPYYFDSAGRSMPVERLSGLRKANPTDFISYLQYTNKKLLELIDQVLAASSTPPVIILLSDHGYRHVDEKNSTRYDFMNLNACFFPDKNYQGIYDSISNINFLRTFFNTRFGQQLPLLKDSTVNVVR